MIESSIYRLEIELTNTCNLKCPLCLRQTHPELIGSKKYYRPLKEIISQLEEFKDLKYITIAGQTSEPTLYPHLFELLKYLIERKIEISLFINGDTHDEKYYKKLAVIFSRAEGKIYFTICGSTQELHEKYRVGSDLSRVLKHLDIVHTFSKKAILNWIIFNYNEDDFNDNKHKFSKYDSEFFFSLPFNEHFEMDKSIHLPDRLVKEYQKIDREAKDINCASLKHGFRIIDYEGNVHLCTLEKMFGDRHCFECGEKNQKILRENKIYHISESEDEESEKELRIDE